MDNQQATDDHRYADTANTVYNVFIWLLPLLALVGMVWVSQLISEGVSSVMAVCAAMLVLLFCTLTYAMAILSKLISKVFRRMEEADLFQDPSTEVTSDTRITSVDGDLMHVWVAHAHTHTSTTHDAVCPSCELDIHMADTQCPRCRASFLEGSPWAPIPKNR